MIKVYKTETEVVVVNISSKFKEVTVSSSSGSHLYSAPVEEHSYGSMGAYIDSWLQAVDGLQPVVVMG